MLRPIQRFIGSYRLRTSHVNGAAVLLRELSLLQARASQEGQMTPQLSQLRSFSSNSAYPEGIVALDRLMRYKPMDEVEDEGAVEDDAEDSWMDEDLADGEYELYPSQRIGKKILGLGRVKYRHIEGLPPWLLDRQQELGSHRTSAQIRRCLKSWMVDAERDTQHTYRWKEIGWGKIAPSSAKLPVLRVYGPEETVAYAYYYLPSRFSIAKRVFSELKMLYPDFRPRRVLDFGCGPGTVAAAVTATWDEGLGKYQSRTARRARVEALAKGAYTDVNDLHGGKEGAIESGEGGDASVIERYVGIDVSHAMLDAARVVVRDFGIPGTAFHDRSSDVVRSAATASVEAQIAGAGRYDLAVATYTLTELLSDPSRRAAVQIMYELLDVGGFLVLVEPGNPAGSHAVRSARQFVLDSFNSLGPNGIPTPKPTTNSSAPLSAAENDRSATAANKQGKGKPISRGAGSGARAAAGSVGANTGSGFSFTARSPPIERTLLPPAGAYRGFSHDQIGAFVVSPCTHDKPCPLSGTGNWCSFSQRVASSMLRKSSEEKFSYVIIQKRPKNPEMGEIAPKKQNKPTKATSRSNEKGSAGVSSAGNNAATDLDDAVVAKSTAHAALGDWIDGASELPGRWATAQPRRGAAGRHPAGAASLRSHDPVQREPEGSAEGAREKGDKSGGEMVLQAAVQAGVQADTSTEPSSHPSPDPTPLEVLLRFLDASQELTAETQQYRGPQRGVVRYSDSSGKGSRRRGLTSSSPRERRESMFSDQQEDEGWEEGGEERELEDVEMEEGDYEDAGEQWVRLQREQGRQVKGRERERDIDKDRERATEDALLQRLVREVDWQNYNPPLYRGEWGRVLRSPIKSKGHITFDVCEPSGQVTRSVLSKSTVLQGIPSLYSALRKTSWGGLLPVVPHTNQPPSSTATSSISQQQSDADGRSRSSSSSGSGSGGERTKRPRRTSAESAVGFREQIHGFYENSISPLSWSTKRSVLGVSSPHQRLIPLPGAAGRVASKEEPHEGEGKGGEEVEEGGARPGGRRIANSGKQSVSVDGQNIDVESLKSAESMRNSRKGRRFGSLGQQQQQQQFDGSMYGEVGDAQRGRQKSQGRADMMFRAAQEQFLNQEKFHQSNAPQATSETEKKENRNDHRRSAGSRREEKDSISIGKSVGQGVPKAASKAAAEAVGGLRVGGVSAPLSGRKLRAALQQQQLAAIRSLRNKEEI